MKLNNINNRKLKDASLTKVETEEWDYTHGISRKHQVFRRSIFKLHIPGQ